MRSSRPVLTVPLLLRTKRQEEGDGASEREDGTSGVWAPKGLCVFMPVGQENKTQLEQAYYQFLIMREGWLVDPGTNWVWRFHRDDKAWVRDPKVFMDRGMPMPDEQPPLLKERRHVPQEYAETIWRNLKSMGWKRSEPLWGASVEP